MTLYYEDFRAGQVFETRRRTISETDLVLFAGWSWDTNPVHTDAVSAHAGRYGERIAHGALGLSVAMGLIAGTGAFEECSVALLGVDEWRFRAPIRVDDTLKCRVDILSVRMTSKRDAGILERRVTVLNQHDEVVQDGRIDLMVRLRPTGN